MAAYLTYWIGQLFPDVANGGKPVKGNDFLNALELKRHDKTFDRSTIEKWQSGTQKVSDDGLQWLAEMFARSAVVSDVEGGAPAIVEGLRFLQDNAQEARQTPQTLLDAAPVHARAFLEHMVQYRAQETGEDEQNSNPEDQAKPVDPPDDEHAMPNASNSGLFVDRNRRSRVEASDNTFSARHQATVTNNEDTEVVIKGNTFFPPPAPFPSKD